MMLFATLMSALAVVCLTLAVVTHMRARWSASSLPGAFRCKIAFMARGQEGRHRWARRVSYAVWVHDVVVVFSGFARTTVRPYAVHFAEGVVATVAGPVRGLGPSPVVLALQMDDGSHALLAAPRSARSRLVGPFLAALVADGTTAPTDHFGG